MYKSLTQPAPSYFNLQEGIVEILFPKQPLRARALEIISVHKIEVSEGVSIFIKGRKIKIPLPYRIKDGQISLKFQFLREGP